MNIQTALTIIIITILIFLYKKKNATKYYTKFIVFNGLLIALSFIIVPIIIFRPGEPRNWIIVSRICGFISGLLGLEWEVRNQKYLTRKKACIVVSNHQSSLDVLGLFKIGQLVNNNCGMVAKKELFYIWPAGLVLWLCGSIFIDRRNSNKARALLNAVIKKVKEDDIKLWIFPEGTRRNNGKINSFKKGAFHIAVNAKLDVVPIVFSSYYFLEKNKRFDSGKIIITLLPPISTDDLKSINDVINETHRVMEDVFYSSSLETKRSVNL